MDCHEKGLSSRFELIRFSVGNRIVKPEDNQPNWNIFDMPTVNPISMAKFHSVDEINDDIDRTMRNNYNEYLVHAQRNFIDFAHTESIAIKLLWKLRQTTASLSTYEDAMDWHLRANGSLQPHESVGKSLEHISAQKMHRKLRTRYNIARDKYHVTTRITLPNSKAVADVLWNDAKAAFTSLLSDPRIVDSDYLFYDNNPFAPPPAHLGAMKDVWLWIGP